MIEGGSRGKGLLASLRAFVHSLIATAQTRLQILASDLEEQRAYFSRILIFLVVGAISFFFAAQILIIFVIVAFWDHRLIAIGALFALFLLVGFGCFTSIRSRLAGRPKMLAATLAEFDKDRTALADTYEVPR